MGTDIWQQSRKPWTAQGEWTGISSSGSFITQYSDQWMKLAGIRLKTKWEGSSHSKQQNNRNPYQNTVNKISLYRFKRNLDRQVANRFIMACPASSPHCIQRIELKIAGDQENIAGRWQLSLILCPVFIFPYALTSGSCRRKYWARWTLGLNQYSYFYILKIQFIMLIYF